MADRDFEISITRRLGRQLRPRSVIGDLADPDFRAEVDPSRVLTTIVDVAIRLSGADMGILQLFDPTANSLLMAAQRGFEKPFLDYFAVVADTDCACGEAMATGDIVIVDDVATSDIFAGTPWPGHDARGQRPRRAVHPDDQLRWSVSGRGVHALQPGPAVHQRGKVPGQDIGRRGGRLDRVAPVRLALTSNTVSDCSDGFIAHGASLRDCF
jgi:hypothetical protein